MSQSNSELCYVINNNNNNKNNNNNNNIIIIISSSVIFTSHLLHFDLHYQSNWQWKSVACKRDEYVITR